ncbi:glycosyltransferase family 2 protein [Flavobacterium sp.]|jgi:glycosyltransferase involved in cell wall biosynthesis|uniref:glycosyltransferase family 2 protein n=1 Tax=Flavobacterium sp. TaxID=239 RepID=UPI0037C1AC92
MITYGHEKFIEQAINGVLMQQGDFELELILSNDCSPDTTDVVIQNIVKNHPKASCITYFNHKENLGMMPNFIFALEQCSGSYVALCEGDDYWTDPYKLQKQVDFLEANPDYVLSFHKVKILKPDGSIVPDFITNVPENYETQETLARLGNYIHTPSVVFRNIIKEFPKEFSLSPIGDYFLYMLLTEHGKLKYLVDEMAVYRDGVGVWSAQSEYFKNLKTAITHSIIINVLSDNNIVKYILKDRVLNFINIFHSEIKADHLLQLNTCTFMEKEIYSFLLSKNNVVANSSYTKYTTKELFTIILKRIIKKFFK